MRHRLETPPAGRLLLAGLVAAGCGPVGETESGEPSEASPDASPAASVATAVTGSPYDFGLSDADYPRVVEVARDVYAYEQIHVTLGETITTVSLVVVTPDGVLVADGQESPEETGRLVETVRGITEQPIRHVVIASDHGDHTGGNSAFPADATFYAHPSSAAYLETTAANPNRPADAPPVVLATEIVSEDRTLDVGGREIRLLHLGRAHTGGDLVVHVPEGRVLFMSETYLKGIFPAMRSAFPTEWLAMLDRALAMDVDVYVPGHGVLEPPDALRAGLETYRDALERVIDEASRLHADGADLAEAIQTADFGELSAWSLYESQAPRAIERIYMERNGALPN
ncbi:MAG: MBL fold metallo-hydrolase [Gemmatimonadetes bacterium]|nr:MBL fold metallo-hydrolase [Gemmatimonadota bacterium]